MKDKDNTFPKLLCKLHELNFEYAAGEGFDFEPFDKFLSELETIEWIQAWTRNTEIAESNFRVFGMDGSGGYASFWCVRPDSKILDQPIVFLGSEGDIGVIAKSFSEYLWLLADGYGPCEAVSNNPANKKLVKHFVKFAKKYSNSNRKPGNEIINDAKNEFPNFDEYINGLCI